MDGWMDGWVAGWLDGWMNGWIKRERLSISSNFNIYGKQIL